MWFTRWAKRIVLVSFAYLGIILTAKLPDETVEVKDGDTFYLHLLEMRPWGVDAPNPGDKCSIDGQERDIHSAATEALKRIVRDQPVTCTIWHPEWKLRWPPRWIATCQAGSVDVAAELVRQGFACDYTKFSRGHFLEHQRQARFETLGVWRCDAVPDKKCGSTNADEPQKSR